MPKVFTSKTQRIGEIGENIAVKFLMKHGFAVLERNYTKKWGEIDIIAKKSDKLYFIEVKSVSRRTIPQNVTRETPKSSQNNINRVTHGTFDSHFARATRDEYQAEDNMHPWKLKRLSRTIQTYLMSNRIHEDREWQLDLLVVYLDIENKKAQIKVVPDIVL